MNLPWMQDRWERKLNARGGYKRKRTSKHTKPGRRPRASFIDRMADKAKEQIEEAANRLWDSPSWIYPNTTNTITFTSVDAGTTTGSGYYPASTGDWSFTISPNTGGTTTATTNSSLYVPYTITTNTDITTDTSAGSNWWPVDTRWRPHEWTPEQQAEYERRNREYAFRDRIRRQITGGVPNQMRRRHRADFTKVTQPEMVALQLLKKMLSVDEWKRYLKYGFVMVHSSKTGLTYQIFRGGGHILVTRRGKKLGELCIHLRERTPPTDRVIAYKVMLECSETQVWEEAGIHYTKFGYHGKPTEEQLRELGDSGGGSAESREPLVQPANVFTQEQIFDYNSQQEIVGTALAV